MSWITAFVCEFSSTRNGIPFGWYHYNGSTVGLELYFSNIPFMDSISFSFLLFASYCLALLLLLPMQAGTRHSGLPNLSFAPAERTSWPVFILSVLFFAFIDMVIDPVALRGDRWFLGKIYYYPDPGVHYGVPILKPCRLGGGGAISLLFYFPSTGGSPIAPSAYTFDDAQTPSGYRSVLWSADLQLGSHLLDR
ncbi:MAG: carotenoid biosynthesis protein [Nitrospiraceae bacterium]